MRTRGKNSDRTRDRTVIRIASDSVRLGAAEYNIEYDSPLTTGVSAWLRLKRNGSGYVSKVIVWVFDGMGHSMLELIKNCLVAMTIVVQFRDT